MLPISCDSMRNQIVDCISQFTTPDLLLRDAQRSEEHLAMAVRQRDEMTHREKEVVDDEGLSYAELGIQIHVGARK